MSDKINEIDPNLTGKLNAENQLSSPASSIKILTSKDEDSIEE